MRARACTRVNTHLQHALLLLHRTQFITQTPFQSPHAARHLLPPRFKHATGNTKVVTETCICSRQLRLQLLQLLARESGGALGCLCYVRRLQLQLCGF